MLKDDLPTKAMPTPFRSEGELFKRIMGDDWLKLHPDIQERFEKNPIPGAPLKYTGVLDELSCSRMGKLMGILTRPLIKGALIPYTAFDVPVDIEVFSKPGDESIFKNRKYRIPGREVIDFTSRMKQNREGEVLEYVGFGLGMKLIVFEKEGNLHFQSDGYFLDLGWFLVPIPGLMTPGKTYLTHENVGGGRFRIRIDIDHVLFGKMFIQAGEFREVE
jgi:hypothetical protein